MKLVKKNMYHTGYFLLDDGMMYPSFTKDLVHEGKSSAYSKKIIAVFGTNEDSIPQLLSNIKFFKKKYGIVPQNYVAELRTGFNNGNNLTQYHNTFLYK